MKDKIVEILKHKVRRFLIDLDPEILKALDGEEIDTLVYLISEYEAHLYSAGEEVSVFTESLDRFCPHLTPKAKMYWIEGAEFMRMKLTRPTVSEGERKPIDMNAPYDAAYHKNKQ